MKALTFAQVTRDNQEEHGELCRQWIDYFSELEVHEGQVTSAEEMIHDLHRRIEIQGNRKDMHFEVCYQNDEMIGFANFAIDQGTVYGLIDAGYGTIMEFYVAPRYRRKGYGRAFFAHIEEVLLGDGAKFMYLCPDPAMGDPF